MKSFDAKRIFISAFTAQRLSAGENRTSVKESKGARGWMVMNALIQCHCIDGQKKEPWQRFSGNGDACYGAFIAPQWQRDSLPRLRVIIFFILDFIEMKNQTGNWIVYVCGLQRPPVCFCRLLIHARSTVPVSRQSLSPLHLVSICLLFAVCCLLLCSVRRLIKSDDRIRSTREDISFTLHLLTKIGRFSYSVSFGEHQIDWLTPLSRSFSNFAIPMLQRMPNEMINPSIAITETV